jgi:hypothetical protein
MRVASAAHGQMRRRHRSRAWRRGRARPEDKTEDGSNVIRADQRDERRKDDCWLSCVNVDSRDET